MSLPTLKLVQKFLRRIANINAALSVITIFDVLKFKLFDGKRKKTVICNVGRDAKKPASLPVHVEV